MDDNIIKIVVAALGSGVLSSFITALYTKKRADKDNHHNYVTAKRKKWREEIRRKTVELTSSPSVEEINKAKTFFEVRLNPNDPEDRYLLELIEKLNPETSKKFSKAVAYLLKHDWERVKRETQKTPNKNHLLFYFLVIAFLYTHFYNDIYSFKTWKSTMQNIFSYQLFIFISIFFFLSYLIKYIKPKLDKMIFMKKFRIEVYRFLDIPFREPFSQDK